MEFLCDDKRHLICQPYSLRNLHLMAKILGIKKCWLHAGRHPHYDIPASRIEEITAKCRVISTREIVRIIKKEGSSNGLLPDDI